MNRQNFDTNSVSNYPLTIDRMNEAQGDWQEPMKILEKMLPSGNCIIAGCESKGAAGWVRMRNAQLEYEVFEVRAGGSYDYLKITENTVTAENSDGVTVTVRVERYLEWSLNATGTHCTWTELPRMRVRTVAQDDAEWMEVPEGNQWAALTSGQRLRVQRVGGRIHLWGSMTYALLIANAWVVSGHKLDHINDGTFAQLESSDTFRLPLGYRPDGDIVVPIRYNGKATTAILTSGGQLLLGRDTEMGDTLNINTYIEI